MPITFPIDLSDRELLDAIVCAAADERRATVELLLLLAERRPLRTESHDQCRDSREVATRAGFTSTFDSERRPVGDSGPGVDGADSGPRAPAHRQGATSPVCPDEQKRISWRAFDDRGEPRAAMPSSQQIRGRNGWAWRALSLSYRQSLGLARMSRQGTGLAALQFPGRTLAAALARDSCRTRSSRPPARAGLRALAGYPRRRQAESGRARPLRRDPD